MARRILNRKELRADHDAAERRTKEEEEDQEETDEESEDEDEEEGEGSGSEEEEEGEATGEDEDEELAPKKKKPAKAAKPAKVAKPKAKPRSRAAKVTRMRVVWGVFNNSNQCVATYEYPKRTEAVEHAARLTNDKRSTHFIQPVKEPMEEPKEPKEK